MLIGGDFNSKAKELLKVLAQISEDDTERRIPVQDIVNKLSLDRTEIKNLLEYLENKEYITVATIGGPFLYGHIQITGKGLQKASRP